MASKKYKVIFNRSVAGTQLPPVKTEVLTKSQAEVVAGTPVLTARAKYGKEPIQITGPLESAEIVEIEAENEEAAACAAVHLLGANEAEGEVICVETANYKKNSGR